MIEKEHREKVIQSGSGIIVAFIVVILFILTATFLRSVLFGMILAYLFLPVQKWYENKILPSRPVCITLKILTLPFKPFKWAGDLIKSAFNKKSKHKKNALERRNKDLSCHLTIITAVSLFILMFGAVSWLSVAKVSGLSKTAGTWLTQQNTPHKLESLRPKLESIPGFMEAKDEIAKYLSDTDNRKQLTLMFLDKSRGFLASMTSLLSRFSSLLLGGLLALFFFSFFLQKMAAFKSSQKGWSPGEYLTESIFSTRWMPKTSAETKEEAGIILNNIFKKLHTWVKGYASIIVIESVVYTVIFLTLGIPYAVILGFIAGCTVLLPFIGPLASGLLTILVYLAVAGQTGSMTIIILIAAVYALMNGIIEQLILYPAFIGEALGLNTLETIIVVLIGGLFAGLPGMIFAVPVASILKYITPRIYACW